MNSREFLEKGLGKFYPDKKNADFRVVFNLLLVYKKIRPCYLVFSQEFEETNQMIKKLYPGIFNFFRIYNNVWESYRAHSLFLKRDRYKHLLKLKTTDYKSWAHGLKKAGYATDKKYADKLIAIIEALDLHRFDKQQ